MCNHPDNPNIFRQAQRRNTHARMSAPPMYPRTSNFIAKQEGPTIAPKADHLSAISPDVGRMIAKHFDGIDLKSFRLASNTTATFGREALQSWIPESILSFVHGDLTGDQFFNQLVQGLQQNVPEAAAKVNELLVEGGMNRNRELLVTPAVEQLQLPLLEYLTLSNIIIPAKRLLSLLRNHKDTIRGLCIHNVALAGRGMSPTRRRKEWSQVLRFIEKHMSVMSLKIGRFLGYDFDKDEVSFHHLKTPQAKYHKKSLRDDIGWYQLHQSGVEGVGVKAVRLGVRALRREINKPTKRRSTPTVAEGSNQTLPQPLVLQERQSP